MNKTCLPVTKRELSERGVNRLDFICITGDAYVDHPSFGIAIISRLLESLGFSVGIIAQPVTDADFKKLGAPAVAFMATGGNIDSVVANHTVSGKPRRKDDYSPGGKGGKRPDYAVTVYGKALKRLFPSVPLIIGGLEASLRRFAHYDYLADKVLPSALVSSGADLLIYGMAELTLSQLAERLNAGERLADITDLRGTCRLTAPRNAPLNAAQCDSFELVRDNKKCYAKACAVQYNEQDEIYGRIIIQRHGDRILVQNPPQRSLTESELDRVYNLSYTRTYHPMYEKDGGVPALEEVEFSIAWTRGCFGFCNFCSIALHQGRRVQTRSEDSVVKEAERLTRNPRFKGYIHDIGGPTANFGQPSCEKQEKSGLCKGVKCLTRENGEPCSNLKISHDKYLRVLRRVRALKGVKKAFVRSGVRYDYIVRDKNGEFLKELVTNHTSGQLKVAPEHVSGEVLACMGKPGVKVYEEFEKRFYAECKKAGREQYLIPYLMSSHPGSTLKSAVELAVWLKKRSIRPEQVQDFYPTPGTVSTAMYYTGLDPFTMKEVFVPRSAEEKAMQRALLQYYKPENRALVEKALRLTKRADLIGDGKDCLIKGNGFNNGVRKNKRKNKKGG